MIKVVNLAKVFKEARGEVKAVDHISFEVAEGQLFTLLGPSGCGKTTTLRCIAGLETPTEGEISIGNQLVFSGPKRAFVPASKRNIGMVFQSYAIWPHMTVFQNVFYPLRSKNFPRSEARERALEALRAVGILDLKDRPAPKLSGGQQQRVALARAIAGDPKILLLDEPLSNLDARLRQEMRTEIRSLQRRFKITLLYVTHDQIEALTLSDLIGVMEAGRIVELDTPRNIYLRPKTRFTASFIGSTNVIPGEKKEETKDGKAVVKVPFGEIHHLVNDDLAGQRKVLVFVRPENLQVSRSIPNVQENVWKGEVKEKIFFGDSIDCQISCNDFLLRARLDSYTEVVEGDQVYVRIDPLRCVTIAADEG